MDFEKEVEKILSCYDVKFLEKLLIKDCFSDIVTENEQLISYIKLKAQLDALFEKYDEKHDEKHDKLLQRYNKVLKKVINS